MIHESSTSFFVGITILFLVAGCGGGRSMMRELDAIPARPADGIVEMVNPDTPPVSSPEPVSPVFSPTRTSLGPSVPPYLDFSEYGQWAIDLFSPYNVEVGNSIGDTIILTHTGILIPGQNPGQYLLPGEELYRSFMTSPIPAASIGLTYTGPVLGKDYVNNVSVEGDVEVTFHNGGSNITTTYSENLPLHNHTITTSIPYNRELFLGQIVGYDRETKTLSGTYSSGALLIDDAKGINAAVGKVRNETNNIIDFYGIWVAGKP